MMLHLTLQQIFGAAKAILWVLVPLVVGLVIGGYLFSESQPRSLLALHKCERTCLQSNELMGLIASVGLTKFPGVVPSVVLETDKTIVIKHPFPEARIHYVIIPKKDIKNIAEVSEADAEYLMDIFSVVHELVKEEKLSQYELLTNGPGNQAVTYLHFHLIAK
jgi:histidine triad (HIT) family protein